jgi:hypothetical protein
VMKALPLCKRMFWGLMSRWHIELRCR